MDPGVRQGRQRGHRRRGHAAGRLPAHPEAGQQGRHRRHRDHLGGLRRPAERRQRALPAGTVRRRGLGPDRRPDRRHRRAAARRRPVDPRRQGARHRRVQPGLGDLHQRLRPRGQHRHPRRRHHHHRVQRLRQPGADPLRGEPRPRPGHHR